MVEDIVKEIEHELKKANKILSDTENADFSKNKQVYDTHLVALGQIIILNDLMYSIKNQDFLYKKHL
jgi:hypothetical protein